MRFPGLGNVGLEADADAFNGYMQNEYKRGVSSWNFNVEDLKAQAALVCVHFILDVTMFAIRIF